MFGVMQHLKVTMCVDGNDASAQGYNKQDKYKDTKPVEIKEAVVVRNGTQGGNSTVDLILVDQEGKEYVVMVTGRLLSALAV